MESELVSLKDFNALEVYLRLLKIPTSYCVKNDLPSLCHWLDLVSDNFASRLKKEYPRLTAQEMNVCCFQRLGYSMEDMGRIMQVKEESIRRTIYRVCTYLDIKNSKELFYDFIETY